MIRFILQEPLKDKYDRPIAYGTIRYLNHDVGCLTDVQGNFKIRKIPNDSIRIVALGYYAHTKLIDKNISSLSIILEEQTHTLKGVVVTARRKTSNKTEIGFYSKKGNILYSYPLVYENAVYIANEQKISGYIDEVRYRLHNHKSSLFALRIRLYALDSLTNLPGNDLLFEDNIIQPGDLKKNNRLSIKKHNIRLPKEGVFVSFQWIPLNLAATINAIPPHIVCSSDVDRSYNVSNYKGLQWNYYTNKFYTGRSYEYYVPCVSIGVSF